MSFYVDLRLFGNQPECPCVTSWHPLAPGLEVHPAAGHGRRCRLLPRHLGHHGLSGDQEARDRRRALQRCAHHLGGVDDALGHEVAVLAVLSVEAVIVLLLVEDLADHNGAVLAGIDGDLARRPGQRLADDLDAVLLVVIGGADPLDRLDGEIGVMNVLLGHSRRI